jgi:hypothetical protein
MEEDANKKALPLPEAARGLGEVAVKGVRDVARAAALAMSTLGAS